MKSKSEIQVKSKEIKKVFHEGKEMARAEIYLIDALLSRNRCLYAIHLTAWVPLMSTAICYSYRRATIGSNLDAFQAG